jgi:hypothetical protein
MRVPRLNTLFEQVYEVSAGNGGFAGVRSRIPVCAFGLVKAHGAIQDVSVTEAHTRK